MPWRTLILAALACGVARAGDRPVTRDFAVSAHPALVIRTYRGSVNLRTGAAGRIHVVVHIQTETNDPKEMDHAIERLSLNFKQDGDTVRVQATNTPDTRARFLWEEKYRLGLAYYIVIPPHCSIDIRTDEGGVSAGDMDGNVVVRAHKGTVYLKHMGGDVDAATDESTLVVSRCFKNAKLADRQGEIRVGPVDGFLEATNLNGDITAQRINGGAKLYDNAGDITLGLPPILGGAVAADTNGGTIRVRMDPSIRCTLHGSSVWGHVRVTDLPFRTTFGKEGTSVFDADFGGGGTVVTLHANGGHVEIKPAPI